MDTENFANNYRTPELVGRRRVNDSPKSALLTSNQSNIHNSPFLIKKNSKHQQKSKFSLDVEQNIFQREIALEGQNVYMPSQSLSSKIKLSDRFIPSNSGLDLFEKFEISRRDSDDKIKTAHTSRDGSLEKIDDNYSKLLQYNLVDSCPTEISHTPNIKQNLLRYRMEEKKNSPYTWDTILSKQEAVENYSRRISSRPYKIMETPGLMDDFYLNLLDWSSTNDIAVGLQRSVFLLRANKTQVSNLFSYTDNKYVSSVIWNK